MGKLRRKRVSSMHTRWRTATHTIRFRVAFQSFTCLTLCLKQPKDSMLINVDRWHTLRSVKISDGWRNIILTCRLSSVNPMEYSRWNLLEWKIRWVWQSIVSCLVFKPLESVEPHWQSRKGPKKNRKAETGNNHCVSSKLVLILFCWMMARGCSSIYYEHYPGEMSVSCWGGPVAWAKCTLRAGIYSGLRPSENGLVN